MAVVFSLSGPFPQAQGMDLESSPQEAPFSFSRPAPFSLGDSEAEWLASGIDLAGGAASSSSPELLIGGFVALGAALLASLYYNWLKERDQLDLHNRDSEGLPPSHWLNPQNVESVGSGGMKVISSYSELERGLAEAIEVLKLYEKQYLASVLKGQEKPPLDWGDSVAYLNSRGWWPASHKIEAHSQLILGPSGQSVQEMLSALEFRPQLFKALESSVVMGPSVSGACGAHCNHDHQHHHHEDPVSPSAHSSALKEFFALGEVGRFSQNFLARVALWSAGVAKTLLWDYTLKPSKEALTHPRQVGLKLAAGSRMSRRENPLNAYVGGSLGFALFWAYEAIIHGVLHIHFMCNHAFQYSLAMSTAGAALAPIHQLKQSVELFSSRLSFSQRLAWVSDLQKEKKLAQRARKNLWLGSRVLNQRDFLASHHSHLWARDFVTEVELSPQWFLLSPLLKAQGGRSLESGGLLSSPNSSHQQILDLRAELELQILTLKKAIVSMALLARYGGRSELGPLLDSLGFLKRSLAALEDLKHLSILRSEEFSSVSGLSPEDLKLLEKSLRHQLHLLRELTLEGQVESGSAQELFRSSRSLALVSQSMIRGQWADPIKREKLKADLMSDCEVLLKRPPG